MKMSILICENCSAYIDTDYEPGAYHEESGIWICDRCEDEQDDEEKD